MQNYLTVTPDIIKLAKDPNTSSEVLRELVLSVDDWTIPFYVSGHKNVSAETLEIICKVYEKHFYIFWKAAQHIHAPKYLRLFHYYGGEENHLIIRTVQEYQHEYI